MRVKCISTYPTSINIEKLGDFFTNQKFGVTINNEYIVIGISFHINLPGFGTGVQIQFFNDDDNLAFAPLSMFDIIDARPSRYWNARFYDDGSLEFQPPSLYRKYYHDDLSDGIPNIVDDMMHIRKLLEEEDKT